MAYVMFTVFVKDDSRADGFHTEIEKRPLRTIRLTDGDVEVTVDRKLIEEFCQAMYDKLNLIFPNLDRTTKCFYRLIEPGKPLELPKPRLGFWGWSNPAHMPDHIYHHVELKDYYRETLIIAPKGKSLFLECLNSWYFFDEVFNYDDIEKPWKQPPMRHYTEAEWAEELHRQEVELDKERPKPITTEGKIAALEARIERIKHPPAKRGKHHRGSGGCSSRGPMTDEEKLVKWETELADYRTKPAGWVNAKGKTVEQIIITFVQKIDGLKRKIDAPARKAEEERLKAKEKRLKDLQKRTAALAKLQAKL
ncbi:hypothetical protein FACS189483_06710 [Spirochaetia bacterium]|nr:hypothetical protein FACS189483_06710 [Spirochaetia bacterium]